MDALAHKYSLIYVVFNLCSLISQNTFLEDKIVHSHQYQNKPQCFQNELAQATTLASIPLSIPPHSFLLCLFSLYFLFLRFRHEIHKINETNRSSIV